MRQITRGQSIQWSVTFFDFNGIATNPLNSFVDITYYNTATTTTAITIPMTQNVNVWLAIWDSSVAVPDISTQVWWHVRSIAAAGVKAAEDGTFMLTANVANTA